MRLLARIVTAILLNSFGLWVALTYIPGFSLPGDIRTVVSIAFVLTVLNLVLKPVLSLILGPVIVLTLGLGMLLVNGVVLFVLDIIVETLRIEPILSLVYATLLFSIINLVFHLATKKR
ncbi:hypothetical protein C4587_01085 [Candidatus Parcubacteria bacterium]|nr:MAG: hypothetical protein C4587_01085 [Candidatus Parcubacteria bacterium]